MTQQTTPRKSGEAAAMIARQAAKKIQRLIENVVGGYDTGNDSMEGIINQAISDAVKGSGAVEALEYAKERYVAAAELQGLKPVMVKTEFWRRTDSALTALRDLTK